MAYAQKLSPGKKVNLADISPDRPKHVEKEAGLQELAKLGAELGELLELMFAAGTHSLLVVMQGLDTAGKDGAINKLLTFANVQSAKVASFKVPTPKELSHDFLWRVHSETPPKGGMTVFNRSHYEDVLVVRVHSLAPEHVWKARYDHINAFESLLVDSDTLVVKFMLHISKDEQEQRLLDREADATKSWKLSVGDWKEREFWNAYEEAYEDALAKCGTAKAPWFVVSANHKWYRDLAITETLVETLRPLRKEWMADLEKVGITAKSELEAYRVELAARS